MTAVRAGSLEAAVAAVSAQRIARRVDELGSIGGVGGGGVTRLGLSVEERSARELIASWLAPLGFQCFTDDACNLFCHVGKTPRVLIGSHLDSVPNGGRYDGALGVVAAVELAEAAHAAGLSLPVEIVGWSAEEGAQYRSGHFGSSAAFGQLPSNAWERSLRDGRIVMHAVREVLGRDPDPASCRRAPGEFVAYLELHIEQGPKLANAGHAVGIVSEIVGITRGTIVLEGRADHAGTTPMADRSDALAAAAECILAVERIASQATEHLVGTVGELHVRPGAGNVVPRTCRLSIELRSTRDEVRQSAFDEILAAVTAACRRRGVRWDVEVADEIQGTALDARVIDAIEAACLGTGLHAPRIVSGAGHDAQNVMVAGVPTGMIFVRSTGGSHNPGEAATAEDAGAGTRAMLFALDALVRSQEPRRQ